MAVQVNERTLATMIAHIEAVPGLAPASLATRMGVTTRSVRTYVRQFNDVLSGVAHLDIAQGGYRLEVTDEDRFAQWKLKNQAEASRIPDTPRERVNYLVSDLLARTEWVTLDDLADILFCSRRTVSKDLKQVGAYLESFGLTLEKRPHFGIRVSGSELMRRVCLANNVLDRMSSSLEESGVLAASAKAASPTAAGGALRHDFHLNVIAACVDRALAEADFHVNAVAYQNLLVHIAIAVERIRAGRFVPLDAESERRIRQTDGWPVAQNIALAIERELAVEVPDGEVAYIAIHLAGKQVLLPEVGERDLATAMAGEISGTPAAGAAEGAASQEAPAPDAAEGQVEPFVVADEAWNMAGSMIDAVRQVFHFDLRDDLELRMNLARHIVPLTVRLKYRMRLENPLRAEIRAHYPLAFSFAREAARVISDAYQQPVSDDEVAYLALSFALAIETKKAAQLRPKNILIVCASGLGSARLLEIRCREEFGEHLGTIQTADVSQLDAIDFSGIDYVFSTVHIDRPLPVPVREVGYFLDDKDVSGLRPLLHAGGEETPPIAYFSPDLFFAHMPARTREQVLQFLCGEIARREDVPEDFIEQVRARERSTSTAFGNAVAMPHPLVPVGSRTFVTVGLGDGLIAWGDKSVQAVFLITVSTDSTEDLHTLYDALLEVASSKHAIERLLSDQRFETLRDLISPGAAEAGDVS